MSLYSKIYRKDSSSTLDVGSAASNRTGSVTYGITYLQKANVCNITGTIDTVQIYCTTNLTGCKVGTFKDNGDGTYSCRSYETIGSVTSGSTQTFTGLRIDAVVGDLLGIYYTAGTLESGGATTTVQFQVNAGNDDADEFDDGSSFSSTDPYLGIRSNTAASGRYNAGFVFENVTIAQGSTVTAATMEVPVDNLSNDDILAKIYGNDVDNANNFTVEADVTSRTCTTAYSAWSATSLGTGFVTSPDIASVVQEIFNRASWVSGNRLCTIIKGDNSATLRRCNLDSYDLGAAYGAKLNITYISGAGSGYWYKSGDQFGLYNIGSWSSGSDDISCYATGTAWIRADVSEFRISDTIQDRVSAAEIYILDPKNTEAGYYSAYQQIKIEEGQTGDNNIIFYGRIDEIVPNFSSQYGQTLKITCRDYLAELTERALNTNYGAAVRSTQIGSIITNYATTAFTQSIETSGSSSTIARDTRNSQTAPLAMIEEFAAEDPWTNTTWDTPSGAVWRWTPSAWTDNTAEADSGAGTPFAIFSSTSSYRYFGRNNPFVGLSFDLDTLGSYGTITWQYWNKATSAWTALTLTQSYDFTADGSVQWNVPAEWGTRTITNGDPHAGAPPDGTSRYWVRAYVSSISTDATANSIAIIQGNGYDYHLDYSTSPHTFKYFRRGSLPDYGPRTRGLTLEYAGTDGDQVSSYAADYSFMQIPDEIITRVIVRGVSSAGVNITSATLIDTALETSLGLVKEYIEYMYGSITQTDADLRAKSILYNRNKAVIRRGEVTIPFYPKYTYSGTTYILRAGHLVRVKCSPQSIDEDMLVQEITYHEPSCMAGIKMMSNAWGRGYGNELTNSIIQLRETNSISNARIGDLLVGNAKIYDCSIDKLTAGSLDVVGTMAAGGEWKAAGTSSAKVSLSDGGIKCYNTSGTQTGLINTDGSGWMGNSSDFYWTTAGAVHITSAAIDSLSIGKLTAGTLGATGIMGAGGGWETASGTGQRVELDNTGIRAYDNSNNQRVQILNDGSGYFGSSTAFSWTTAGAVTAQGITVRSGAASGARVQIDSSYIAGYSDATTKQFYISASDGKAYFGGGGCLIDATTMKIKSLNGELPVIKFYDYNSTAEQGSIYAQYVGAGATNQFLTLYANNTLNLYADAGNLVLTSSSGIITCSANMETHNVSPDSTGHDLGDATNYWNVINYNTLTKRGGWGFFDKGVELQDGRIVSDVEALLQLKEDFRGKKTPYGINIIDQRTLPKCVFSKAKKEDGTLFERDSNDYPIGAEDGEDVNAMMSIMIGAIKELAQRIKNIETK